MLAMSATAPAVAVAPARARLDSIDLLRGAVMILMALDHARDFYTSWLINPVDLKTTTPFLFATRWITHFCAPVFSFLAGTGAYLSAARGKPKQSLSWFLFSRGLWLIVLDLTVVHAGFTGANSGFALITLWALGGSMIVLAALVFLPTWAIAAIGAVLVGGHNALDGFQGGGVAWRLLHTGGPIAPHLFVGYPILPWIGVMALGYAFGEVVRLPSEKRRRTMLLIGSSMIALFVILRSRNIYGDPDPWSMQKDFVFSLMSFVNTEKYPPSLSYTLMTLGPAIIVLALLDGVQVSRDNFFVVFGRVPMFYYLLHLFFLHIPAWIYFGRRFGWSVVTFGWGSTPREYGSSLAVAYLAWALAVAALYPLCRWYAGIKARSKNPLLSYL
jgi:uncharacterized membrane protein